MSDEAPVGTEGGQHGVGGTPAGDARASLSTPDKRTDAKHRAAAGGFGELLFRVHRFVIERTWSLLLLAMLSEGGAFAMFKAWDLARPTGRAIVQTGLLVLGLIAFWAWPRRARFMVRLCFLLVFAGAAMFLLTWSIALMTGEASSPWDFQSVVKYWGGEIARNWLVSGALLAILMWGGRRVFRSMRESPAEKARRSGNVRND